ncbi:MAG: rhodanese-like domain-containing protein, partial [Anaerolineae bacterium]|nr:rhodanese-like domain-containing protein [Anaerolineae bacterium]
WKPENLAKLPKDKKIVAYCYSGHTAGIVATVLNLLGYDAINLRFGIMGWTKKDEVVGAPRFDPATQPDYPVETVAPPTLPVTGGEGSSLVPAILIAFGGISLAAGIGGLFILRRRTR